MIKPKTHIFKLKVMLNKLEAVNNKVSSRCHAALKIQNEEISFKVAPQLKKNVALFNAEVQYDNFSIAFDEITGIYDNKSAVLQFEIETQGTKVKIGEVQINLGAILNQKKYRLVNTFPLAKCYDKTAKVRLSVDFIPISAPAERNQPHQSEQKEGSNRNYSIQEIQKTNMLNSPSGHNVFTLNPKHYKSRLAEQSNYILQEKIYQYEQKMDNYRLSQTHLQEKMHEQISVKDQHISELTLELNRRNQQIQNLSIEGEQLKNRLKQVGDQLNITKERNRSLMVMIENLQRQEDDLKKQNEALKQSLENQSKTKENKEKYFSVELAKYTQRYLSSEQERNKIVFELESKFKEEIEKKESNYRLLAASNDKKHNEALANLRERLKQLQAQNLQASQTIQKERKQVKKLSDLLSQKLKELSDKQIRLQQVTKQKQEAVKNHNNLSNELQTLSFSYQQQERESQHIKDQLCSSRKSAEQVRMELMMANQTIQEQRKAISKYSKELQVHQERQYYLTEKYNDQLQMKSIHQQNIIGESHYFREQIHRLKNKIKVVEQRAEEESHRNTQVKEGMHRIELELANKNQMLVRLGEEKIILETQNNSLRGQIMQIEEALNFLKDQNLQMSQYIKEKKMAMEGDKSLQWSYKIEELQMDISEMVEKFKIQKDLLKDNFKKEEAKRKQEISFLNNILKRAQEENDELKRTLARKDAQFKDHSHNRHDTEFTLKQTLDQLSESREKMRIYNAQIEQLENRLKQAQQKSERKLRDLMEEHKKQMKGVKKAQSVKSSLNKVISNLLQYMTKPYSFSIMYQEIISPELDVEMSNMINISLRKFCEQRVKIKQTIQKLQHQAMSKPETKKNSEKNIAYSYQKRYTADINIDSRTLKRHGQFEESWKPSTRFNVKDNYLQMDQIRDENGRLKRQISELRVKIKNLQEEVSKAQRNAESERYSKEAVKHEMEEIQDELQKLAFQLKRKQKIIVEYESEMKDMQTEILATKHIQTATAPRPTLTRSQIRLKEKEDGALNSRNAILIKDLQSKLHEKSKQIQQQSIDISKYKHQIESLNEVAKGLKSQVKIYEAKLKEKTNKISIQEDQLLNLKTQLEEQHQRDLIKQQHVLHDLQEQCASLQEELAKSQQNNSILQRQLEELQRKIKLGKEESRIHEAKAKKEYQTSQARLKQTVEEQEHQILILKNEIQQIMLRNKQSSNKNNALNTVVSKKNEEIEKHIINCNAKNNEIIALKDEMEEVRLKYEANIASMSEKIEELQTALIEKGYELQEYRFFSQGRLIDLEKRLEEAMSLIPQKK